MFLLNPSELGALGSLLFYNRICFIMISPISMHLEVEVFE